MLTANPRRCDSIALTKSLPIAAQRFFPAGLALSVTFGEAQVNANDGTCEGIKYKKWNCFTVQFHPEANGGPKDTEFLFDRFLNNVKAAKKEVR